MGARHAAGKPWATADRAMFRVRQGLGGGMVDPIMMAVVAKAAGPIRMGRVVGLISVPITLGPSIGGLILHNLSWQWMFLINVPIALLAIIAALVVAAPAVGLRRHETPGWRHGGAGSRGRR